MKTNTTSAKVHLTKKVCDAAEPASVGGKPRQRLYLDDHLIGFGLCCGTRTKTFFAQRSVHGKTKRVTIDRYGVITIEQAREQARALLAEMGRGIDPVEERRKRRAQGITLEEAWELMAETLAAKKASPRTVERYRHTLQHYLGTWMKRPLTSIDRAEVRSRHQQLAKDVARGEFQGAKQGVQRNRKGLNTANDVMRVFRAVYNRAMKQHPELPPSPTINVDWFKLDKTQRAIPSALLKKWYDGVGEKAGPLRKDYMYLVLFTGLRRTSATEIRWEHVDLERRSLHIPRPKGGEERAFTMPLSDYLVDLFKRRLEQNNQLAELKLIPAKSPFVFPAFSASGHMVEPKLEIPGVPFTVHDLRRTFITVAESLDVSGYAIKALVNHSLPRGDVTAGYVSIELDRLRGPMQQITDRLLEVVNAPEPIPNGASNVLPIRRRKRA